MKQTYFNVLEELYPELAEEVRGTINDPFYRDERLESFFSYITEKQ